jgi:hypothetical protein
MKTYIVQFQRAEQYDQACNCTLRSFAKAFDENATLSEIVQWVTETAGTWYDDYNILTNPQIIGIEK